MKHPFFFARTVLVKDNNIEEAATILNKILTKEGVFERARKLERYEKPTMVIRKIITRRRVNYERCRAIYNEDMTNKVNFLLRKNRQEPYPGCH